MIKRFVTKLGSMAILGVALVGGCSSSGSAPEGISVDATANDLLEIGRPQVTIEKGVMTISGTVARKAGVHDVIDGRVDIDVTASNGDELAWLPCLLTPNPVPDDQTGQSTYLVRYGLVPPAGSTVQVYFVDSATANREDVDDAEAGGAGGAGHMGGGHGGGHHGMHSGRVSMGF